MSVKCTMPRLEILAKSDGTKATWFLSELKKVPSLKSVHKLVKVFENGISLPSFSMCQDVWLEVRWLCKPFITGVERTNVWSVTSVNANMGAKVKIQWKSLATAFKCTLLRRSNMMYYKNNHTTQVNAVLVSFLENMYRYSSMWMICSSLVTHNIHLYISTESSEKTDEPSLHWSLLTLFTLSSLTHTFAHGRPHARHKLITNI